MLDSEKVFEMISNEYGLYGLIDPESPPDSWIEDMTRYAESHVFRDEESAAAEIAKMAEKAYNNRHWGD